MVITYWQLDHGKLFSSQQTFKLKSLGNLSLNKVQERQNTLAFSLSLDILFSVNHTLTTMRTLILPVLPFRPYTIWDPGRISRVPQHLLRVFVLGKNSAKAEHLNTVKYLWLCDSQRTAILFPFKSTVDAFSLCLIPWLFNSSYLTLRTWKTSNDYFCSVVKKHNKTPNHKSTLKFCGLHCWIRIESYSTIFSFKCCKLIKTLKSWLYTTFPIRFTNFVQI